MYVEKSNNNLLSAPPSPVPDTKVKFSVIRSLNLADPASNNVENSVKSFIKLKKKGSLTEKRPYVIIEIIMFTQENVIRGEGSITSSCSGDEPTILPRENRESSGDRVYIHIRGPLLESPGSFKTY